ncbi:hypothetical protein Tco_1483936 [Tanacetum coccineum]
MVQLKQARFEIDRLEDHKEQLQAEITQESESLKSKIEELEKQLSMEKEECKRISCRCKKDKTKQSGQNRAREWKEREKAKLKA